MGDAAGMGDEEFTYDMATSMIHDPEISSYLDKEYPRLGRNGKIERLQYDLEMYLQESVNEITPAQQRYVDMAASKPSKPKKTKFRKDIEGAKRMMDSSRNYSSEEIIKKYGEAAFNAVNAENEYLEESNTSVNEKLKPSMGAGAYVDDFKDSKAPQFKGKSKKKKQEMAVAAYLSAKDKKKVAEAIFNKLR